MSREFTSMYMMMFVKEYFPKYSNPVLNEGQLNLPIITSVPTEPLTPQHQLEINYRTEQNRIPNNNINFIQRKIMIIHQH